VYSDISVSLSRVSAKDTVAISIRVRSMSGCDGQEVAQVYLKDMLSSVVVPNIQSTEFSKAMIKASRRDAGSEDRFEGLGLGPVEFSDAICR
jgi:hypothetical protein